MQRIERHASFGGWQDVYEIESSTLATRTRVGVYLPPQALQGRCPVVYWLSGLTCSEQNFITKAGAQRCAAELGLILVAPDTSPRGDGVADADTYDLGIGAGFYVNAMQAPWRAHYRLHDYVVHELPAWVEANFPASEARALGMLNRVVKADELDEAIDDLCEKLAQKSPVAMRLGLQAFADQADASLDEALPMLRDRLAQCLATEDAREGLTAFLEKRPPVWKGR